MDKKDIKDPDTLAGKYIGKFRKLTTKTFQKKAAN